MGQQKGKLKIMIGMLIFGTIGLFVKNIPLSSSQVSFFRGLIGGTFLLGWLLLGKGRVSRQQLKDNWKFLFLGGLMIGANWILLFEAYNYTTVSLATLSYYMQPVFLTLLAPFFLKEQLTPKKLGLVLLALSGMVLIIGVTGNEGTYQHLTGIILGLIAALCYATGVIANKKIRGLEGLPLTTVVILMATLILTPYVALREGFGWGGLGARSFLLLLILGVVHTGIAYVLVFQGIRETESQTFAILSYIDPVTAVLLSALFLQEPISGLQLVGGGIVLSAALLNEVDFSRSSE